MAAGAKPTSTPSAQNYRWSSWTLFSPIWTRPAPKPPPDHTPSPPAPPLPPNKPPAKGTGYVGTAALGCQVERSSTQVRRSRESYGDKLNTHPLTTQDRVAFVPRFVSGYDFSHIARPLETTRLQAAALSNRNPSFV